MNDFGFPLLMNNSFNNPKAITRWNALSELRPVRYLVKTLSTLLEDAPLLAEQNPTTYHNFVMSDKVFLINFTSLIRSLLNPFEVILQLQMEQFLLSIEATDKKDDFITLLIWSLRTIIIYFTNEDYSERVGHFKINRLADVVLYEILTSNGLKDKMLELSFEERLPTDKFGRDSTISKSRNSFRSYRKSRNS